MKRLLRSLVVTALTAVVWLVAAPAWASTGAEQVPFAANVAGYCSWDGSSAIAPPPLMIPIEASLEQGSAPIDCDALGWTGHTAQRAPEQIQLQQLDVHVLLPRGLVVCATPRRTLSVSAFASGERSAVTRLLERPPRGV